MADALAGLSRRRKSRWTPPPAPRTLERFACESIRLPDGPQAGQAWVPASEPLQLLCLAEFSRGNRNKFVLVWPSQRGKTLAGVLAPCLHTIVEQRSSVGYLMPSIDKLAQNWEGKIKPAIEGAGYKDWLPQKGPGSKGGRPAALSLRDPKTHAVAGRIYFMSLGGGGKETAISSVSPRAVVLDEADDAETEAQLALAFKRTAAYGSAGRAYVVSTVNDRRGRKGHPVLDLAARGTMSRLAHKCPHCGDMAPITMERFALGAIACTACGTVWTSEDATRALRNAELKHAHPDSDILSIIAVGPDFFMGGGLAEIEKQRADAQESIDKRGDHALMRLWHHKVWCEPYTGDVASDDGRPTILTRNALAARSATSTYSLDVDRREDEGDSVHLTHLLDGIENISVGADLQRGGEKSPPRIYFSILGDLPRDGKIALVGWGTIAIAPAGRQATDGEIMAGLDRLDRLLIDWAPKAPIVRKLLDINDGGAMADRRSANAAAIRWLRGHRDWWGIRGSDAIKSEPRDIPGWVYHRSEASLPIRHVVTLNAIRRIHGDVLAGTLLVPQGLGRRETNNQFPAIVNHWCGTVEYEQGKWSSSAKDRAHHPEWQRRIDYLHATAYARCGIEAWRIQPTTDHGPARKYGAIGDIK